MHLERKEPESNQTLSVRDNTMSDPNNNRNNNSSKYTRYPPKFPITSSTTSKEIEEYKVEFRNQQTYCNGAYTGAKRLLLDMHGDATEGSNAYQLAIWKLGQPSNSNCPACCPHYTLRRVRDKHLVGRSSRCTSAPRKGTSSRRRAGKAGPPIVVPQALYPNPLG